MENKQSKLKAIKLIMLISVFFAAIHAASAGVGAAEESKDGGLKRLKTSHAGDLVDGFRNQQWQALIGEEPTSDVHHSNFLRVLDESYPLSEEIITGLQGLEDQEKPEFMRNLANDRSFLDERKVSHQYAFMYILHLFGCPTLQSVKAVYDVFVADDMRDVRTKIAGELAISGFGSAENDALKAIFFKGSEGNIDGLSELFFLTADHNNPEAIRSNINSLYKTFYWARFGAKKQKSKRGGAIGYSLKTVIDEMRKIESDNATRAFLLANKRFGASFGNGNYEITISDYPNYDYLPMLQAKGLAYREESLPPELKKACSNPDGMILLIAAGGGSDPVQTFMLSKLFIERGVPEKNISILSFRAVESGSQGISGASSSGLRSVINPVNVIRTEPHEVKGTIDEIYEIGRDTEVGGPGSRYLLSTIATLEQAQGIRLLKVPVVSGENASHKLMAGYDYLRKGEVSQLSVIVIDTGGDIFCDDGQDKDTLKSTQNFINNLQLTSGGAININAFTCVFAAGVDCPENFGELIEKAGSKHYRFSDDYARWMLGSYSVLEQRRGGILGKTPQFLKVLLGLQIAGKETPTEEIEIVLNRPWVDSLSNGWDKFGRVNSGMAGLYITDLDTHISVVEEAAAAEGHVAA